MDFLEGLMTKVGLSREKAEEVIAFIKENASKIPEIVGKNETLSGLAAKLPGGLGGSLFGVKKDDDGK